MGAALVRDWDNLPFPGNKLNFLWTKINFLLSMKLSDNINNFLMK